MSYFAKCEATANASARVVTEVISADQSFVDTQPGFWVQTSYNSNMRKRYAGIGYSYNAGLDAFVPPKPFESWVLNNETADWESPVGPAPELTEAEVAAGSRYQWDEENTQWDLVTPEPAAE